MGFYSIWTDKDLLLSLLHSFGPSSFANVLLNAL